MKTLEIILKDNVLFLPVSDTSPVLINFWDSWDVEDKNAGQTIETWDESAVEIQTTDELFRKAITTSMIYELQDYRYLDFDISSFDSSIIIKERYIKCIFFDGRKITLRGRGY